MLLRHTGTQQLLGPACGVALGYLWAPSALLLDCTAVALRHFEALKNLKNEAGVSVLYMEALFARG